MEPLELGYLMEFIKKKNNVLPTAILYEFQMICFFLKKRKTQEFKGM